MRHPDRKMPGVCSPTKRLRSLEDIPSSILCEWEANGKVTENLEYTQRLKWDNPENETGTCQRLDLDDLQGFSHMWMRTRNA